MTRAPSFGSLAWQIVILVLSVFTLIFMAADTLFALTAETSSLFFWLDTIICLIFLADVAYQGLIHHDRRRYWRWGWLDLLSSIPAVALLRWGRLVRIVRIARVLRAFRSTRALIQHLFRDPAKGTSLTVALAALTLVVFGSIAILNVESGHPGTNIRSAGEALWWSFVTVTTVGYGDYFPVSTAGRVVAAILMATGIGLFGTLTAYLANAWLKHDSGNTNDDELRAARRQLELVTSRLEGIEERLPRRQPHDV